MANGALQTVVVDEGAYQKVLIGGNHLASSLIGLECFPDEYNSFYEVLERCGQLQADMWAAWKAIMDFRECVELTQAAALANERRKGRNARF